MSKRNLLDTHALIWFIEGSKELSKKAKDEIENENAINFISIASLWEIAIKVSLGKLEMLVTFPLLYEKLTENSFQILSVTFEDTLLISGLPFHHRDPFDRMIVAQSIRNQLTIISKDEQFASYNTKIIW